MERDNTQLKVLLQERLQKLERLAQEIMLGQEACVALDLEALRNHDHQKEQLCSEIRLLDLAIRDWSQTVSSGGSLRAVAAAGKLGELMEKSESARVEVASLNGVYALFLARSQSTLKVMANVVSHYLGVDPRQEDLSPMVTPFERSA